MPRKQTMKQRTRKIKKALHLRHGTLSKTENYHKLTFGKSKAIAKRYINYMEKFSEKIQNDLGEGHNFLNPITSEDDTRSLVRKERLPATLAIRVLTWKGDTKSIYEKMRAKANTTTCGNEFENFIFSVTNDILQSINEATESELIAVKDNFYCSRPYPYLCGTPDICVKSSPNKPMFVVECKQIESKAEFSKIFRSSPNGCVVLKKTSAYYWQVQLYLNIFLVSSGFLVVKHLHSIHVAKVYFEGLKSEAVERLESFYLFQVLPSFILKTEPKKIEGRFEYLTQKEKIAIRREICTTKVKQIFSSHNNLTNFRFKKHHYDR